MFDIKTTRDAVEKQYIGFSPNTTNVKPVHLANGMFRVLLQSRYDTNRLFRFIYMTLKDGNPLLGSEPQTIYNHLAAANRIDVNEVSVQQLGALRIALRKIVSADRAVYVSKAPRTATQALDRMDSYSAGAAPFVSSDRIGQDGGEFLAAWLQRDAPSLAKVFRDALNQRDDPITLLAAPLLDDEMAVQYMPDFSSTIGLNDTCHPELHRGMANLGAAAECLAGHLSAHPNKLARLRMGMLLGSFLLVRYLADLEHLYQPKITRVRPLFLLDFSTQSDDPIRAASQRSYVFVCQAITRFYTWMFAQYLEREFPIDALVRIPRYSGKKKTADLQVIENIWHAAIEDHRDAPNPYHVFGQAMYDILALLAEATPVQYMRWIGIRCGLFWPPYNLQPTKQMAVRQDLLEVLIRSVANQGDMLTLSDLQNRLWKAFGIVIGGRPDDLDLLIKAGIYQADSQALEQNQTAFVRHLRNMTFARLLADGVLEVQVGTACN